MNYAAAISLRQQAVCRYALPEDLPRGLEPGGLPCLVLSALHDDIDVFGSEPYEPRSSAACPAAIIRLIRRDGLAQQAQEAQHDDYFSDLLASAHRLICSSSASTLVSNSFCVLSKCSRSPLRPDERS